MAFAQTFLKDPPILARTHARAHTRAQLHVRTRTCANARAHTHALKRTRAHARARTHARTERERDRQTDNCVRLVEDNDTRKQLPQDAV